MKKNVNQKQTIGTRRTLLQLRTTFISLLCEKPFEQIQVTEICERSMIPKSTFYNYFEDKYDLLQYFMNCYEQEFAPPSSLADESIDEAFYVLNNLLDCMDENWEDLEKLFRSNPPSGYFRQEFEVFFVESCYRIMLRQYKNRNTSDLPLELVAKSRAYIVMSVIEWVYFQAHPLNRQEIIEYIYKLSNSPI